VDDDVYREVAAFQRQAADLRRVLEDAQAHAPESATGADPTGAVRVALGRDGVPDEISVDASWRSRLAATALAGAVHEAFQSAAQARLAEWTKTLERGRWRQDAERVMRGRSEPAGFATPLSEVPAMFGGAAAQVTPPRGLDALAEEMMSTLRRADEIAEGAPALVGATGRAASGKVVVTVSRAGGLTGCDISARWAEQTSPSMLNRGLAQALAEARRKLAAQPAAAPAAQFDALFAEVLDVLQNPARLVE
jgi:DNA-binding protein YbaB